MSHPMHHDRTPGPPDRDSQAAAVHDHPAMDHDAHTDHMVHAAGGEHADHTEMVFARAFWIALLLTLPVAHLRRIIGAVAGLYRAAFPGSNGSRPCWPASSTGTAVGSSSRARSPSYARASPGMMTLVALAITTAYFYSLAITFGLVSGMPFYWELATLVTIMLLGHWMEMRAIGSAQNALSELAKLLPDMAERMLDGRDRRGARRAP